MKSPAALGGAIQSAITTGNCGPASGGEIHTSPKACFGRTLGSANRRSAFGIVFLVRISRAFLFTCLFRGIEPTISHSNLGKGIELSSVVGLPPATRPRRTKAELMGGRGHWRVAATMMSGAYAQEANTGQFNTRSGHSRPVQPNASMRQGQNADERACQRAPQRNRAALERRLRRSH